MTDGETKQMLEAMLQVKKLKTAEALRQICEFSRDLYKTIRDREANQIDWLAGMQVRLKSEYQRKKPFDESGIVQKVNRRKLIVRIRSFDYVIPKTMLEIV